MIIKASKHGKEIDLDLLGTYGFKSDLIKVTYTCDICGKENTVSYRALSRKNKLDMQICLKCSVSSKEVIEKRKNTCIEKYGYSSPMHVDKFKEKIRIKRIKGFSFVKDEIEKENYILLSTEDEYHNSRSKLRVVCNKGHESLVSWFSWSQGYRCKICKHEKLAESQRKDFDYIKKEFEKEGYKIITSDYINNRQKIEFICPKGHRDSISWSGWLSGHRCGACFGNRRHNIEYVRKLFSAEGYTLLTKKYLNNKQKLEYVCPKGHKGSTRLDNWFQGCRCIRCFGSNPSKSETEIFNLVKSYFQDAEQSDRNLISPLELDIIIPSKKIAIEYCGLYWHSELNGKDRKYHLNKLEECNKRDYRLITIFEDEWISKKDIVISRLKNILGVNDQLKYYARKCKIKEIDTSTKNEFLEANHIQGKDFSSVRLGAYIGDSLVSVMTFSKGSIAKGSKLSEGVYELNRFCSSINCSVVGIASRFLKYFINNYNPKEIYSYADRRWSNGDVYFKLGFQYIHDSSPNYWYIEDYSRVHRFNFRKSELEKKLDVFDSSMSEWKNMITNGYDRIWDCGNIKFEKVI